MKKTELKPYPNNPRQISQEQFERLGNSMEEFGDLSGIVFNAKDGYLISGHQRVASLKERYGESAVEIKITEEKDGEKRGFVEPEHIQYREVSWDEGKSGLARLAANKHGGEWDDDLLQEELDKLVKLDVNIELSGFDGAIDQLSKDEIWQGMPEFENDENGPFRSIIVHFDNVHDISSFSSIIKQNITDKTKYIWFPKKENLDLVNYQVQSE